MASITLEQQYVRQANEIKWQWQREMDKKAGKVGPAAYMMPVQGPALEGHTTLIGVPELVLPELRRHGIPFEVSLG